MTDQELWERAVLAALSASGDDDDNPEAIAKRVAEIADKVVLERDERYPTGTL